MPTLPTSLPRWGDVSAAIVVPTSGKLDIGWVPGERPPAQYLNWWFNLTYQWINYLSTRTSAGWHDFQPAGTMTGVSFSGVSYSYVNVINVAGSIKQIPIYPRVGDVITDIRFNNTASSSTPIGFNLYFYKAINGASTTLATYSSTASFSTWKTDSYTLGTPVTVADGEAYWFEVDYPSSSGIMSCNSVGYKVSA